MRVAATLAAAVLAALGTAAAVFPGPPPEPEGRTAVHIEAPPAAHTGGFGEPTCLACHIGAPLNVAGGRVTVEGLPSAYTPGEQYVLTVVLESEEMGAAGFQIGARFADGARPGASAGTLAPVDARVGVTVGPNGVAYAHQTSEGTEVDDPDVTSWTVTWTAPTGGAVAVHAAANSGNGDNSPLSDLVYTTSITLEAAH